MRMVTTTTTTTVIMMLMRADLLRMLGARTFGPTADVHSFLWFGLLFSGGSGYGPSFFDRRALF